MIKSFLKVVVVLAMLIAFVGQALAYSAMSCEMSNNSHQVHQSHMKMGHDDISMMHSNMDHSSMNHDINNGDEDCCSIDCVCPASACANVSIANSEFNATHFKRLTESITPYTTNRTNWLSTSLFRPPIFA